jgi:hypothetical protein
MPTSEPPAQDSQRAPRASPLLRAVALLALLFLAAAGLASWLTQPGSFVAKTSSASAGALERAAAHVASLQSRGDAVPMAAQATQEGHWRFINRAGETFTAGTPDEMRRAPSVLYPDKAGARLALYVTEDSIFQYRAALKVLPANAELFVVAGSESYRVLRRSDGTAERLFAEVRPNLVVELTELGAFRETAWQLARPLDKAAVRVLALEPGGPSLLSASPRIDPGTRRALIDAIDPERLPGALGTVRGQALLVTGRVEGDLLHFQPSSGRERSLMLGELFRAAEAADVNLIVLHAASTPRQPGGRNWLWLTVQVDGLDEALQRARLADFLNALGGANRRLVAAATLAGPRTMLGLTPAGDVPGGTIRPVTDFFSGIAADISGKVVTTAVHASLRSAERQQELDRRLVPGIPWALQAAYFVLLGVGLLGVPLSRVWWERVWPQELASDYAGRMGYLAAAAVRALAYALIFVPATAVVAGPWNIFGQVADALKRPVRWMRRLAGRKPVPEPGAMQGTAAAHPTAPPRESDWSPLAGIGKVVPRR